MAMLKISLMVVTNYNHLDANHPTGVWFEEFAIPYKEFKANGFEVTVASPRGGATPIDPRSEPSPEQAREATEAREALQNTVRLDSINANDFDAIFIPGGHGPLFDFPGNIPLQNTLRSYMEQGKMIASVCHGPAAFNRVLSSNSIPPVAHKTITPFPNHYTSNTPL